MGYFSNGFEWDSYQCKYCFKCVNFKDVGCMVEQIHEEYNYEFCNKKDHPVKKILDRLIPVRDDHFCGECSMFLEKEDK